ncbi:DUF4159 domain-containing protein [Aquisphaera insulae]|uniref:DUF4159 domain-containing protein n=1 Tax=Aquisphaera insulae TaxID=2712864 RepID=UPI0013EDB6A5|nr:DUF4159 domain-containing protein [Aquisphaera insulae]
MPRARRKSLAVAALGLVGLVGGLALAQPPWGRGPFRQRQSPLDGIPADRAGVPDWKVDERFKDDVFTFARVQYSSHSGMGRRGRGWGGPGWDTDWPDSDLNFSYRLQQLTSLKVNPNPVIVRLTEDRLFDYPFIYIIEPGGLVFSDEEVAALRRYLLNGGFLMVDDFWGEYDYQNLYRELKRVFPDREPEELDISHPVFQMVYRLKERPQVPSIHTWQYTGETWEDHGPGSREVHYRGISDDKGRLMALICHNTDLGDGWEREGENAEYFHEFSEKKSYPMGINIVTYAMTH